MNLAFFLMLAILGAVGGFTSGLLGFGGGVVMFPLLFYVPQLLGLERLDAKTVAAVVVTEVFFSTLVGGTVHWRSGRVHGRVTVVAGVASAAGSFVGAVGSKWVSEWFLLLLFGLVTFLIAAIMFIPSPALDRELILSERVAVPPVPLSAVSFVSGIVVGFLGAGNFIFVPMLIHVFNVPIRIAIGSSLFIAMMNTASGFLGKLITGQVPFIMALVVVAGATLGVVAGERAHGQLSPRALRYVYAGMVGLITVTVWITLLS